MRDRAPIRHVDYFWWSLWIFVGAFVLQNVLGVWLGAGGFLFDWFALSIMGITQGKVWTLFTYSLMHADMMHFFFNMLVFFFIGRWLSRQLEPKKFLHLIIASAFLGSLVWLVVHAIFGGGAVIGMSAITVGMTIAACLLWPGETITLLLFFLIPVNIRARVLMWVVVGLQAAGFLFIELPQLMGRTLVMNDPGSSFSAHLGGALAGYLFYRLLQRPTPLFESVTKKVSVEAPKWTKKRTPATSGKFKVNLSSRNEFSREVDRILDKINREGFQSLSPEEHKILDEAGDVLKK
ncbi:rhomboid family intramembrane serine protease [Cerasicoccus arenae]|uniref:Rhomboid family intramembrane serine protease n=2 Tax=Cerasicoccus arenae TaxID=424488 RepID=A0A8J3GGB8_9BACT|nr:rhomboid family intramembrane serine protease [Cerasicoccus arenae]GHC12634.1 rhomboid family intramembrane serine protease [Cerasicoccus arenae]